MPEAILNGNTLTIVVDTWADVIAYVDENRDRQIAISPEGDGFAVVTPLSKSERGAWAHLYHAQGRDPYEEFTPRPLPTKPSGPKGPKPTGPRGGGGGTPGAGRQVELTYTEAIAA